MSIRQNLVSFEARLRPAPGAAVGPDARGKAEREHFLDGLRAILRPAAAPRFDEFEVRLYRLDLPDGTPVQVHLEGRPLGPATVHRRRLHFARRSARGESVPTVRAGDRVTVEAGGVVLLEGTFCVD